MRHVKSMGLMLAMALALALAPEARACTNLVINPFTGMWDCVGGGSGGVGDVAGASNLTTAGRLVMVSASGTVTEIAGVTWDASTQTLTVGDGTKIGALEARELAANGSNGFLLTVADALSNDTCLYVASGASTPSAANWAMVSTGNTASRTVGSKTYSGCREVTFALLDAQVMDVASQAEAEAGTDTTKVMTPLRVAQAIAALASPSGGGDSDTFGRRAQRWTATGGSSSFATFGETFSSAGATAAAGVEDASFYDPYVQQTSDGTSGDDAGYTGQAANYRVVTGRTFDSYVVGGVKQTTNERVWIGHAAGTYSTIMGNDQPSGAYMVGFRYSTNVPDANWKCVTANNGTFTVTDSGVAADTVQHTFRWIYSTTAVTFYIDGLAVCGGHSTANIPVAGTEMITYMLLRTLAAEAKVMVTSSGGTQAY